MTRSLVTPESQATAPEFVCVPLAPNRAKPPAGMETAGSLAGGPCANDPIASQHPEPSNPPLRDGQVHGVRDEENLCIPSSTPPAGLAPAAAQGATAASTGAPDRATPSDAPAPHPPRWRVLQDIVQRKRDEADVYHILVQDRMGSTVYAAFNQLMHDFRAQRLGRDSLIDSVMHLFRTDREVCLGFNRFLGPGYVIEWGAQEGGVMGPMLSPSVCGRKPPRAEPPAPAAPDEAPASPRSPGPRPAPAPFLPAAAREGGAEDDEAGRAPEEVAARTAARDALRTALAMRPRSLDGLQMALELAAGAGLDESREESLRKARSCLAELRREVSDAARLHELGVEEVACPTELLCPITRELMHEPVVASDGFSYEKSALLMLLNNAMAESPLTREPLQSMYLPNVTLLSLIREYKQRAIRLAEAGIAYARAQDKGPPPAVAGAAGRLSQSDDALARSSRALARANRKRGREEATAA